MGRIVPFTEAHLTDRYVGWLNDPEVVRFSELRHRRHDRRSCEAYRQAMAESRNLFLAIETPDFGHVGNVAATFDRPNRSADLSIVIGEPKARRTGLASEAWCNLADWLLGPGGMRRLTAGTMECNHAMIALMRKSGMAIEAIRPAAFLLDGKEIGCVLAVRFADTSNTSGKAT